MSHLRGLVTLIAMLSLAPYAVEACSCSTLASAQQQKTRSDRVFLGRVSTIQTYKRSAIAMWLENRVAELGNMLGKDWRSNSGPAFYQEATLTVVENFKGSPIRRVAIITGWGGGDCGVPFERSQTYLVFARHVEKPDQYVSGICDGTGEANRRRRELAELRTGI